jgi:hypothetical protein
MEHDFTIYFSKRRQFCEVFLWNVHPTTFYDWGGGRWGYYHPVRDNDRNGKFGELHFVKGRLRFDTIVHELDHLRTDYMWSRGFTITRFNEERMAKFLDELTRKFLRELRKKEPGIKL